jgi:hypothetical protein
VKFNLVSAHTQRGRCHSRIEELDSVSIQIGDLVVRIMRLVLDNVEFVSETSCGPCPQRVV